MRRWIAAAIVGGIAIVAWHGWGWGGEARPESGAKPTARKSAAAPFQGVWYQCGTANAYPGKPYVYSGPCASYCAWHRPMAVHAASQQKTYFVFGNAKNWPAISYYDHKTKTFAAPVVLGKNMNMDAHRNPTLMVDEAGYLYVFYGAHGDITHVVKSAEPYAIGRWQTLPDLDKPHTSYPQPWQLRTGELFVSYRQAPGWCTQRSRDGGKSWEPARVLIDFPVSTTTYPTVYAITIAETGSYPRRIHIAWSRLGGGTEKEIATKHAWARRHNVYYACSDDGGDSWHRSDGTPYRLPIDQTQAEEIYDSGEHGVWLKDMQIDPYGKPLILLLDADCATYASRWKVTRRTEGGWKVADVAESDHMYDNGAMVVVGEKDYRLYGATTTSQPYEDGGLIDEWQSVDGGATWKRLRTLTPDSPLSHNHVKAVVGGTPEFRVFWSYGDSVSPPKTRDVQMYFFGEAMQGPKRIQVGTAD